MKTQRFPSVSNSEGSTKRKRWVASGFAEEIFFSNEEFPTTVKKGTPSLCSKTQLFPSYSAIKKRSGLSDHNPFSTILSTHEFSQGVDGHVDDDEHLYLSLPSFSYRPTTGAVSNSEGTMKQKRRSFSVIPTSHLSSSSKDTEDSLNGQVGNWNRSSLFWPSDETAGDYNPPLSKPHSLSHSSDESDDSLTGHDSCDSDSNYTRNSGILDSDQGKMKCTLLRAGDQRKGKFILSIVPTINIQFMLLSCNSLTMSSLIT